MDPNTVITLIGWAVIAGIGWNRLSAIKETQEDLVNLIRDQNSRIDKLELWRARVEGKKEGIAQEKNRRMEGDPNRKLQG